MPENMNSFMFHLEKVFICLDQLVVSMKSLGRM